ncbi:MAG: hypothetical protein QM760_03595 [Nibricoccus sp.]
MNSRSRLFFLISPLLAAFGLFANSGCMSTETRMKASDVAVAIETTASARDQRYEQALRDLVRQTYEAHRLKCLAEFNTAKARQKTVVYEAFETEKIKLEEKIATQLSTKLNPVVSRLLSELNQERQLTAAGHGSREKEQSLALQLAATMTEGQRQAAELSTEATVSLAAHRERLLKMIDATPAPAELTTPLSEGELTALFAEVTTRGAAYRSELLSARESLQRFIAASNPEAPARVLLNSFLGDALGAKLGDALSGKVKGLQDKLTSGTNDLARKGHRRAEPIPPN